MENKKYVNMQLSLIAIILALSFSTSALASMKLFQEVHHEKSLEDYRLSARYIAPKTSYVFEKSIRYLQKDTALIGIPDTSFLEMHTRRANSEKIPVGNRTSPYETQEFVTLSLASSVYAGTKEYTFQHQSNLLLPGLNESQNGIGYSGMEWKGRSPEGLTMSVWATRSGRGFEMRGVISSEDGAEEYRILPVPGGDKLHVVFQVDTYKRSEEREFAQLKNVTFEDDQSILKPPPKESPHWPKRSELSIPKSHIRPVVAVPEAPPPPPPGSGFLPEKPIVPAKKNAEGFDHEANAQRRLENWKSKQRMFLESSVENNN